MAFPIVLLLAGLVYFCFTVWLTRKLQYPVWKESLVPTMLYGVGNEARAAIRAEARVKGMNHAAKQTVITFKGEGGGLLVSNERDST